MRRPKRRNFHALLDYLWVASPIAHVEIDPLRHFDDLVIVSEDEDPFFHVLLEQLLRSCQRNGFHKLQV
jgi:hypothetical protein